MAAGAAGAVLTSCGCEPNRKGALAGGASVAELWPNRKVPVEAGAGAGAGAAREEVVVLAEAPKRLGAGGVVEGVLEEAAAMKPPKAGLVADASRGNKLGRSPHQKSTLQLSLPT